MRSSYKLNSVLGLYDPAFFRIELDFPFYWENSTILNMPAKKLAVFVHEYIHFLQDISTFFGLNNLYVFSEYIHGAIAQIYKEPLGKIVVPIKMDRNYSNIELNQFVNSEGLGATDKEEVTLFVRGYKRYVRNVPYQTTLNKVVEIYIRQMNGDNLPFGAHAIRESMAYIMERHLTVGSPSANDYPYNAAYAMAQHIYPRFCWDDLNLMALCDMSLQSSMPGYVFVNTLEEFKKNGFIPSRPEEVYDYFYDRTCIQMKQETSFLMGLLPFGVLVGERLKTYYEDRQFKDFHDIISRMIGTGLRMRLENRYWLLDMAKMGDLSGHSLSNNIVFNQLLSLIGAPLIKDSESSFFVIPPSDMNRNTSVSSFQAIKQFEYLFREGNSCCSLYEWCEKSSDVYQDDRCIEAPWTRCTDARLCPFAALWHHWKLEGYEPVVGF